MIVERQQQFFVQLRAVELAVGDKGIDRTDHLQFLRPLGAAKAVDIAAGVQIDLAPDPDRIKRYLDFVQTLGGAALAPKIIVSRVLLNEQVQIAGLLARRFAVGRMAIDDAVLVPPIAAEEIAQNAALVDRGAIRIVQPVEGGDAGERRRFLDRHPPLRHAKVRLPDAADFAVRPRLMAEPFDDVVEVFLLVLVEQAEFAARFAAAADIHIGVDVAALHVQSDRAGLAPEKLRRRRQRVVVVAVRRRRQHHGKRPLACRHVERHRDLDAVMNADLDLARLQLVCHRCPRDA